MSEPKHIPLPADQFERVKAHAERRGVPVGEYVLEQLRAAMDREDRVQRLISLRTSTTMPAAWYSAPFWLASGGRA